MPALPGMTCTKLLATKFTYFNIMNKPQIRRSIYQRFVKRVLDFSAALLLLILVSPFLLIIFVILRIMIGSPVILRQKRPGLMGELFTIYKFRTMTDQRDENGSLLPDEQRITNIGRMLRSYSLDELPEMFNVLKGDLSLIGPRPLMVQYLERYTPEQARRHEAIPGITGWAQVNGRNNLTWEEKFSLDVWYVDHQSFVLDIRILMMTIWKVLKREGISSEGFVSAPEFMGLHSEERQGLHE